MKIDLRLPMILGVFAVLFGLLALTFEKPSMTMTQWGYRGTGMAQVYSAATIAKQDKLNVVPAPQDKVEKSGKKAREVYQNVQVLGDLDENEFNRLMVAITEWVSPDQGCAYCHGESGNFAHDDIYTKVVSRRMIQMTQDINANWKSHVQATGVTCYTCHHGQNVPANIWFNNEPAGSIAGGMAPKINGQNTPVKSVAYSSLPYDYSTAYLEQDNNIRVGTTVALPEYAPGETGASVQRTEYTYGLMMHMSSSLGVNCTYCHNTNNFSSWKNVPPQRASAWYGIRMVRAINTGYMNPLLSAYAVQAPHRLGALGDAPKANCATCHQGAYKPLNGASMVKDYPELSPPTATKVSYIKENAAK
jgi:photosynthetic reaction center cytochrome c subunit